MKIKSYRQQRGFAAVLILLSIIMVGVAIFGKDILVNDPNTKEQQITQTRLLEAKAALLNYLAINGRLPCPADVKTSGVVVASEGTADAGSCGVTDLSVIGLLPWKTLGLVVPKDGSNSCFWYAVSGNLKNTNKTIPINADSDGRFQVRDTYGALLVGSETDNKSNAAAIIFAPGSATKTDGVKQNRTASGTTRFFCPMPAGTTNTLIAKQHLDSAVVGQVGCPATAYDNWNIPANAGAAKTFIQGYVNGGFPCTGLNDRLAWVSADEFGKASTQYAATEIAKVLKNIFSTAPNSYPRPTAGTSGSAAACSTTPTFIKGYLPQTCSGFDSLDADIKTLTNDNLHLRSHYALSAACAAPSPSGCSGDLAVDGITGLDAIVIVRGRDTRPCNPPSDCFESTVNKLAANTPSAKTYESPLKTKGNNDVLVYTK